MDDDEVAVETQPRHAREPLRVHDRVGRIAGPPAPVHPHNLLRGGAVGHGLPQLRARRPQALLVDALQLPLVSDGRSACVTRVRRISTGWRGVRRYRSTEGKYGWREHLA